MIKFLHKLLILWKKKKQLEEVLLENKFFHSDFFGDILDNQEETLRERLGEIRAVKTSDTELIKEAIKTEEELTNLVRLKGRIAQAEKIEDELKSFIQLIKQNLWK